MLKATCVSYLKFMNSVAWQRENFQTGHLTRDRCLLALAASKAEWVQLDLVRHLVIGGQCELDRLQKASGVLLCIRLHANIYLVHLVRKGCFVGIHQPFFVRFLNVIVVNLANLHRIEEAVADVCFFAPLLCNRTSIGLDSMHDQVQDAADESDERPRNY